MSEALSFDIRDIERTVKMLNDAGKSPQKAVTRAAGRAGTILKRAVKGEVPRRSGTLKKSIVRVGERSRRKGKKVYQVTFDRKMNEQLQKPIRNPGQLGGRYPKGYYPASMEYGYLVRVPGEGIRYMREIQGSNQYVRKYEEATKLPSKKIEGLHFLEHAADHTAPEMRKVMIDKTMEELEKIWTAK